MINSKNVAVITDNPIVAKRFYQEVLPLIKTDVVLDFYCSPYTKVSAFSDITVTQINLKNEETVHILCRKELVISIHCKQLFPSKLVHGTRCINVHPGYNPINRGWYPQVFAIINNTDIGITIHEIDEKLDHGGIIFRKKVSKFSFDTSLTLYKRLVEEELNALKKFINVIIENNYDLIQPEIEGRLFLKKDFNSLCELDTNMQLTMGESINILRALTHGEYKNAYFKDENGEKIYISVNLSLDSK